MKIKNIYNCLFGLCVAGSGMMMTSCNDFLDVLPLNDVVLENYWTKESDVTSVLMGCYEGLQSEDCVTRMGLWGEARSDNMKKGTTSSQDIEQLMKENILPTNNFCNWTSFYQTINRCNILIHYAPQVQELDPNYMLPEMKSNIAEATFIRTLCYFYLIRTFRDVPYSVKPSIDDMEEYRIPADSFDVVLDNLITDMEAVKDDAQLYFYKPKQNESNSNEYQNSARVTRPAMYALLADLYLWKGDWAKCEACCDYVIQFKQEEFDKLLKRRMQNEIILFNDIPLLLEKIDNKSGNAYTAIFGQSGHSFESLFEIDYDANRNKNNTNKYIRNYFYYKGSQTQSNGIMAAVDELYKGLPSKDSELFNTKDCRPYESIFEAGTDNYLIAKYGASRVSIDNSKSKITPDFTWRSDEYAHWVVYRLTDVMLMKAEALVQQGSDRYQEAFDLVNAINRRAVNSLTPGTGEVLKFSSFSGSQESMEKLVMDERQRELLFEGKRWFDLVRDARRKGSNKELGKTVTKKQKTNISGIQIRLADPNALYMPYFRNELRVNPYLKQNPAYNTGGDADLEKN